MVVQLTQHGLQKQLSLNNSLFILITIVRKDVRRSSLFDYIYFKLVHRYRTLFVLYSLTTLQYTIDHMLILRCLFQHKFSCFFYIIHFVLLLLLTCCSRSSNNGRTHELAGSIHFLDTVHSLGVLQTDNPVDSFDFRFVNTGSHPVVILATRSSCECTSASYPMVPVLPGDTSYVRVTYNGRGRKPEFISKSVSVTSSASVNDVLLEIYGELK